MTFGIDVFLVPSSVGGVWKFVQYFLTSAFLNMSLKNTQAICRSFGFTICGQGLSIKIDLLIMLSASTLCSVTESSCIVLYNVNPSLTNVYL
jgi:hypothetical protein